MLKKEFHIFIHSKSIFLKKTKLKCRFQAFRQEQLRQQPPNLSTEKKLNEFRSFPKIFIFYTVHRSNNNARNNKPVQFCIHFQRTIQNLIVQTILWTIPSRPPIRQIY